MAIQQVTIPKMSPTRVESLNYKCPKPPTPSCSLLLEIDNKSFLRIENCLNELTPEQREQARKNLGVEELTANSVMWGNLIGDIENQEDLIKLITSYLVDLSEYASKDYVDAIYEKEDELIKEHLEAYYPKKWEVTKQIVDTVSKGTVDLSGYVTEEQFDSEINNIRVSLDTEYATDEELALAKNELSSRIDAIHVPENVSELTNDSGYITKEVTELDYFPTRAEMQLAIAEAQLDLENFNPEDLELIKGAASKEDLNLLEGKLSLHIQEALDLLDNIEVPSKTSELENDSLFVTEELVNSKIEAMQVASGGGIPIFDSDMLSLMDEENKPAKYISIPSEADFKGEVTNNTYTTSINSNYVDILFSALRSLQAEVAKLRNAFRYGINSYTDTNTAMSSVLLDYSKNVEDEPLWAVEESDLSLVSYLTLGEGCELVPAGNVDVTNQGSVGISGSVIWEPDDNVKNVTDPKLFLYLTTTSQGIKLNLEDGEEHTLSVNLEDLGLNACDVYNYLIVLSRTVESKGSNYIWVSVSNDATDRTLAEGYYNGRGLLSRIVELAHPYSFASVELSDMTLSKFDVYSKYQDFSKLVIPSKPIDNDYKFEAAHITIRSCATLEIATSIVDLLLENELVFISGPKLLYIKSKGQLVAVGSAKGATDDPIINNGMTEQEIIQLLVEGGYVQRDENGNISVNSISDLDFVTFVNKDTNKHFKFTCDAYGNLTSQEINDTDSLAGKMQVFANEDLAGMEDQSWDPSRYLGISVRGAIGQIGVRLYTKAKGGTIAANATKDLGLYTDRLKIGAVYVPFTTDTIFGCSHAYVELENTSNQDINLKGIRLYYKYYKEDGAQGAIQGLEYLDLTGTIKAGSTYLIRGKQYAQYDDANCFIKVKTFDLEWYDSDGKLIDFTFDATKTGFDHVYGLALVYLDYYEVAPNTNVTDTATVGYLNIFDTVDSEGNKIPFSTQTRLCSGKLGADITLPLNEGNVKTSAKFVYIHPGYYVDARVWTNGSAAADTWIATTFAMKKNNALLKNTFMLDPAKQAFQANNTAESSRFRLEQKATDVISLQLNAPVISYPNSPLVYPVSNFTPKASWEGKNVISDKTQLDPNSPNMVSCFFGIDTYTTRCFNWISCGLFDEYVWLLDPTTKLWKKFESYKTGDTTPADTSKFPYRKGYPAAINNAAYARSTRRFPGAGTLFTSHKCIIQVVDKAVTTPTTYKYVVARDKNGAIDPDYCSEEMQFTLYPESYTPRIYLTSDQQGFHWIEYQVWNGVAKLLQKKMDYDASHKNIVPILINTGDATQNGTRINEWLDYYIAGKNLFLKYELLNVVGNNDLCDTNPDILGTGDDIGKSNSYFFHLFNCYEINPDNAPIINGIYVPSFYYNDWKKFRLIMLNSELTVENCKNWFGMVSDTGKVINLYTGWEIAKADGKYVPGFKTIYSMLYDMMNVEKSEKERIVLACHEMPYTVITHANITLSEAHTQEKYTRSAASSLSGSHTNLISVDDGMSINWFSRLCEYFNRKHRNVRLVLGGHKHTYTSTYPVRELFYFTFTSEIEPTLVDDYYVLDTSDTKDKHIVGYKSNDDGTFLCLASSQDGFALYEMQDTLEVDPVYWTKKSAFATIGLTYSGYDAEYHLTKFPLTRCKNFGKNSTGNDSNITSGQYFPYTPDPNLEYGIVYFMDLASGYKLTSNKELPSPSLKFSYLIPKTVPGTSSDTASTYQLRPMVIITRMEDNEDYDVELLAAFGIMTVAGKFTLFDYDKVTPFWGWYDPKRDWVSSGYNNDFNPWYPHKELEYNTEKGKFSSNAYDEDNGMGTEKSGDTPIFAPNGANTAATVAMDITEDHTTLKVPFADNANGTLREADFYHRKNNGIWE